MRLLTPASKSELRQYHVMFSEINSKIKKLYQLEDKLKFSFFLFFTSNEKNINNLMCFFFPCSNPDPCLSETAQHEEQTGEQDRGRRAEEDPHGRHHGPPGSAGGENEQDSGFH